MTNELLDHSIFLEPEGYLDILYKDEEISKKWMQIFYVARCLFSEKSEFPIKGFLAPLLERKEIFPKDESIREGTQDASLEKLNMAEDFDVGRIYSIHQISHILPREFIIYPDDLFYKKLLNKELLKKEFRGDKGFSVNELVYGQEQELNSKQKVYILFDNSSSMSGEKFNKLFAAKAMCLEYLRKVQKETPQICFRYFNQEPGPIVKIEKVRQIKELIEFIVNLNTLDCYRTNIDRAILQAIKDIKRDPDLRQAEIIMFTDGLGDIPSDIKEQLGKIKFHMVLISGFDMDRFLKLYPTRESWQRANVPIGSTEKSPYWRTLDQLREISLQAKQVYSLQEASNIFIRIPSFIGERFPFTNAHELDQIEELRQELAQKLKGTLAGSERYEVSQRIKFFMKYLRVILSKSCSIKLRKRIKSEINEFGMLLKNLMKDSWFASTLDTSWASGLKRTGKDYAITFIEPNNPLIMLQDLLKIPGELLKNIIEAGHTCFVKVRAFVWRIYGKWRLRRRFSYINSKISQIMNGVDLS